MSSLRPDNVIKRVSVCAQLEQLKSELAADRETLLSSESLSTDLMKEKALLEKTLETLRENSETQVRNTHSNICRTQTCSHAHLLTNSHMVALTLTHTHNHAHTHKHKHTPIF